MLARLKRWARTLLAYHRELAVSLLLFLSALGMVSGILGYTASSSSVARAGVEDIPIIGDIYEAIKNAIIKFVETVRDKLVDFFSFLVQKARDAIEALINVITAPFRALVRAVYTVFDSFTSAVSRLGVFGPIVLMIVIAIMVFIGAKLAPIIVKAIKKSVMAGVG